MIQDIYPHKLNNRFDPSKRPDENSLIFSFSGIDLLINGETLPRISDLKNVSVDDLVFLFTIDDDKDFFLYRDVIAPENIAEGFEYINVRALRGKGFKDKYMAMAIYTGLHLAHWYRNFKYCGRCGKPTRLDDRERALRISRSSQALPRSARHSKKLSRAKSWKRPASKLKISAITNHSPGALSAIFLSVSSAKSTVMIR